MESDSVALRHPDALIAQAQELERALGPFNLVLIGIGSIIGAGIFVITGTAAAHVIPNKLVSIGTP